MKVFSISLSAAEAIIRVTRETEMKVLITCEDKTQIAPGREVLYEPLPGNEMHRPIMCIANGIPATVGRWDEQTNKGFMWHDIGLEDWLFTMDDAEQVARIPETILAIAKDPAAAKGKAAAARGTVMKRQDDQFSALGKSLAAI